MNVIHEKISGELTDRDHKRVAAFVEDVAGIQLPGYKRQLVETRLRKRMRVVGLEKISNYVDYVFSEHGEQERSALIDVITTNKTDFFREPAHFDFLISHLERQLRLGAHQNYAVKIWSAACSSGEEPYTIAMLLAELQLGWPEFRFRITATDICSTVLNQAKNAVYRQDRIGPISERLRKKYLLRSKDELKKLFRVDNSIRSNIDFGLFNLISGEYAEQKKYDAIFCRNVMIYFNDQDRAKVIRNLVSCLVPGGLLFLGHSETIGNQREGLRAVSPTVYKRVD
ncbi:MAG TPA: chemotaxis protein [Cellvibrio sp.]|nr:chemotaxis protein [Cellvibrio sp.]